MWVVSGLHGNHNIWVLLQPAAPTGSLTCGRAPGKGSQQLRWAALACGWLTPGLLQGCPTGPCRGDRCSPLFPARQDGWHSSPQPGQWPLVHDVTHREGPVPPRRGTLAMWCRGQGCRAEHGGLPGGSLRWRWWRNLVG